MRRDARILNIYEGTNEVQRFLILRELCAMVADWTPMDTAPDGPPEAPRWTAMRRWKETLRSTMTEAAASLGDSVWQDAAMQTAFFPLAEMAGELYLLDATLYRLKWLDEHQVLLGDDYTVPMVATGKRAATQCLARLQALYERYNRGRHATLNSRYPVESVAADAAMAEHLMAAQAAEAVTSTTRITCLIRPVAIPSPTPQIGADGALSEKVWRINPSDEHALAGALAIAAASSGHVTVSVVSCGGAIGERLLREALGAGAERAVLLGLGLNDSPAHWAEATKKLAEVAHADLLLVGANQADADAPLGAYLAGHAGYPHHSADQLTVANHAIQGTAMQASDTGPIVINIHGDSGRIHPSIAGMARAMAVPIPTAEVATSADPLRYSQAAVADTCQQVAHSVDDAAKLIRQLAEAARANTAPAYQGEWQTQPLQIETGVWAVVQGHENQATTALRAAAELGRALGEPSYAIAIGDEAGIRQIAGVAKGAGIGICFGLDSGGKALSESGRQRLLATLFAAQDSTDQPIRIVTANDWRDAVGAVAGAGSATALSGVTGIVGSEDGVDIHRAAYAGQLTATSHHREDEPLWLTVADAAPFAGAEAAGEFALAQPEADGSRFTEADFDLSFEPPVANLKGAEVIVDMGLGAGTATGMALAEQLMNALSALSLTPHLGATRKVTQGLGLLPQDQQIGQTGTSVNPKLILCLGISGAPQHTDYIGSRAQVIAFNKDPDAPIMSMDKAGCTVHPVVGDLFETVPKLIERLRNNHG